MKIAPFLLVMVCCLAGCEESGEKAKANERKKPEKEIIYETKYTHTTVSTINYDGHIWILVSISSQGGVEMLHHIDCPCKTESQEQPKLTF